MKVIAMKPGFQKGQRRRTGDIFEMAVPAGKDGKPKMPTWVKAVTNEATAKAEAAAAMKAETDRLKAGALAASGGAAAKVSAATDELAG